jgi:hypothetical protein
MGRCVAQAATEPALVVGLVLAAVQGVKVARLEYQTALDLMKGADRPLALKFVDPSVAHDERCAPETV